MMYLYLRGDPTVLLKENRLNKELTWGDIGGYYGLQLFSRSKRHFLCNVYLVAVNAGLQ